MKLKIVVRVSMNDNKSRSKALKISVGISGVVSAALSGANKDEVVVVGENIDAVELARQLRKGVGHTDIVTVGEDKKEAEKPAAAAANLEVPPPFGYPYPHHHPYPYGAYNTTYPTHQTADQNCTIM